MTKEELTHLEWKHNVLNQMSVELTKDDIKNGWTAETLAKYHRDRVKASSQRILEPPKKKPDAQKGYNPLKWRG